MSAGTVVLILFGGLVCAALGVVFFGARGILRARDAGQPPPVRRIIAVALGVLSLPALLIMAGTAAFILLRGTASSGPKPAVGVRSPDGCPGGGESPCGAALRAIHALERNDIDAFEATLLQQERGWLAALPQVSAAPQLQGTLVLRALLEGRSQFSLEELRDVRCVAGFQQAHTALDGLSASLRLLASCRPTHARDTQAAVTQISTVLHARRVDGRWLLSRGPAQETR